MNPDQKPWLFVKRETALTLLGRLRSTLSPMGPVEEISWRSERRRPWRAPRLI